MRSDSPSLPTSRNAGFTLAEILLAMLVFAVAISTILALLARSIETANEIMMKDEAITLSSAVDSRLNELPFFDSANPNNAYRLIREGTQVFAYQYRAHPNNVRADGTLQPSPDRSFSQKLGTDYVVTSGVRAQGDPELVNDFAAIEGRLFLVRLSTSSANPFTGALPADPDVLNGTTGYPAYNAAVLVALAEFFPVPALVPSIPAGVNPVFTFHFAVRR